MHADAQDARGFRIGEMEFRRGLLLLVFYEPVWSSPLHFFSRLAVVFLSQGGLSSSPVPHSLSGRPAPPAAPRGSQPGLAPHRSQAFGSVPPGGGVVSRGFRLAAPEPARPLGSIQTSIRDGYFNHSHDDSSSFDARCRMGERALLTRGPLAGCPTNDPGRSPSPAPRDPSTSAQFIM